MADNTWMTPHRGAFEDGYTPQQLTAFFRDMLTHTGIELVCVWDDHDRDGPHGDSEWYILDPDSTSDTPILRQLAGDLWPYLFENPDSAASVDDPGDPDTWTGTPVTLTPAPRWTDQPGSMTLRVS